MQTFEIQFQRKTLIVKKQLSNFKINTAVITHLCIQYFVVVAVKPLATVTGIGKCSKAAKSKPTNFLNLPAFADGLKPVKKMRGLFVECCKLCMCLKDFGICG